MSIETTDKKFQTDDSNGTGNASLSQQVFTHPKDALQDIKDNKTTAEGTPPTPPPEHQSFLAKAGSEVLDFGEGLYHGAIESPIDGAIQLTNHAAHSLDLTSVNIPELHLVDADRLSHSVGGVLGNVAGTALDIYAISAATGGVAGAMGGSSMMASALRFGAIGAAYTTALTPTDANSPTFYKDRLTNGAVALATMAATGGAAGALDGLGTFAAPAARSLAGTLTYGALAGAAGGVANAEAKAVLKDGNVLPSISDLAKDVGTYAAFGMAYGGAAYAYSHIASPAPQTFDAGKSHATVTTDASGNPVKVDATVPALGDPSKTVGFQSTKMTTGEWQTTAWEDQNGVKTNGDFVSAPEIDGVKIDGKTLTLTGGGLVRTFNDGGDYARTNPEADAREAAQAADWAKHNITDTVNGETATRTYNSDMRLSSIKTQAPEGSKIDGKSAWLGYDDSGTVDSLTVREGGQPSMMFSKQSDNSWLIDTNNNVYKWNGDVKVIPAAGPGTTEQIQFTPAGGGGASTYNLSDGIKPVAQMINDTAPYVPGGTGRPVLRVDASGQTTLTGGTAIEQKAVVNGTEVGRGQTVVLKPEDQVQFKVDVGDRYPVYQTREVNRGVADDGTPLLGTTPLKPNTTVDFDGYGGGTKVVQKAEAD